MTGDGSEEPDVGPSISPGSTISSLIRQVKASDEAAWCELVDLYGPLVLFWSRRAGVAAHERADLIQEVFVSVHRGLPDFEMDQPQSSFRGWLLTITRSRIADFFRRKNSQPTSVGGADHQQQLSRLPAQVNVTDTGELSAGLRKLYRDALQILQSEFQPQTFRAFQRLAVDGLTGAAVAEELGMQRAAVYNAKARVLRRLRELLGEPIA